MTTRQSRHRSRIFAEGGSQLALLINRKATLCLEEIQARTGETKTAIVERLLWLGADKIHDPATKENTMQQEDIRIHLARASGNIEGLAFFAAQALLNPEVYPHREEIARDLLEAIEARTKLSKEIGQ